MEYVVYCHRDYERETLGRLITNESLTDEEICARLGIDLAITQDEYENMPENGLYAMEELEIVPIFEMEEEE